MAVVNNTNQNYTLYYNILEYFKTIMKNHPGLSSATVGDITHLDMFEFPDYPLGNVLITDVTFGTNNTDYSVQLTVADKIKNKNDESTDPYNKQIIPFLGIDDTPDIHANTLAILNDLTSYTQRSQTAFEIDADIECKPFAEQFNNGLAGWVANFTLRTHNNKDMCLFDLNPQGPITTTTQGPTTTTTTGAPTTTTTTTSTTTTTTSTTTTTTAAPGTIWDLWVFGQDSGDGIHFSSSYTFRPGNSVGFNSNTFYLNAYDTTPCISSSAIYGRQNDPFGISLNSNGWFTLSTSYNTNPGHYVNYAASSSFYVTGSTNTIISQSGQITTNSYGDLIRWILPECSTNHFELGIGNSAAEACTAYNTNNRLVFWANTYTLQNNRTELWSDSRRILKGPVSWYSDGTNAWQIVDGTAIITNQTSC